MKTLYKLWHQERIISNQGLLLFLALLTGNALAATSKGVEYLGMGDRHRGLWELAKGLVYALIVISTLVEAEPLADLEDDNE